MRISNVGIRAARAAGAMAVDGVTTTAPQLDDTDLEIENFLDPKLEEWLGTLS